MSPTFERLADLDLDANADMQYRVRTKPQLASFTPIPSRRSFKAAPHNGLHRRRKRHYCR